MLQDFGRKLEKNDIDHRIISIPNDGRTSFGLGSIERITYLAKTRNRVLEPIQSSDPSIRVPEWNTFTKIIFLNDIVHRWQDIVRLIGTKLDGRQDEDYDMVCAVDFAGSGEHDAVWPWTIQRADDDFLARTIPGWEEISVAPQ